MKGGEIFIPKLPSVKIIKLAQAIAPKATIKILGIRPGEKVHEVLITEEESRRFKEYKDYYVIAPQFPYWKNVRSKSRKLRAKPFSYKSDTNKQWLTDKQVKRLVNNL